MDRQQANLQSIHVLERTRTAFICCREALGVAIAESDSEVNRLVTWLQNDRRTYWRNRINRLQEDVVNARSALFRKETLTSSKDSKPSTVDERNALLKVKALLHDAENRAARTKFWSSNFASKASLFKGAISNISSMQEVELPRAILALGKMMTAMEGYVREDAPDLVKMFQVELDACDGISNMKRAHSEEAQILPSADSQDNGNSALGKNKETPS